MHIVTIVHVISNFGHKAAVLSCVLRHFAKCIMGYASYLCAHNLEVGRVSRVRHRGVKT